MTFDAALLDAYVELGLISADQKPVHLPTACPMCTTCWKGASERVPPMGSPASEISGPWIGAEYAPGGVLVLLINMNEYGGWDLRQDAEVGMRHLGRSARASFLKGARLLFGGPGYRGTMVWVGAVSYAASWLADRSDAASAHDADRFSGAALADAMDRIVITQHIKCSPSGSASAPTPEMWRACGPHVLRKELEILRPGKIIVVGSGENDSRLRDLLPSRERGRMLERMVTVGTKNLALRLELQRPLDAHHAVDVLTVPHPATPGGTSGALLQAVGEMFDEAAFRLR